MNRKYATGEKCTAPCNPPCERQISANGLCRMHYLRQRKGFRIDTPIKGVGNQWKEDHKCCVKGCVRTSSALGYCRAHYTRWRRGLVVDAEPLPPITPSTCSIDGCGRDVMAHGLCEAHYHRMRREKNRREKNEGDVSEGTR